MPILREDNVLCYYIDAAGLCRWRLRDPAGVVIAESHRGWPGREPCTQNVMRTMQILSSTLLYVVESDDGWKAMG